MDVSSYVINIINTITTISSEYPLLALALILFILSFIINRGGTVLKVLATIALLQQFGLVNVLLEFLKSLPGLFSSLVP